MLLPTFQGADSMIATQPGTEKGGWGGRTQARLEGEADIPQQPVRELAGRALPCHEELR